MAWVDRELKRRAAKAQPATTGLPAAASEAERIRALWERIESANGALPAELQLAADAQGVAGPLLVAPDGTRFVAWLRAPDGAALALAADTIRYVWPQAESRKSNNFWIRWDAERGRYVVRRRIGSTMPPTFAQYAFDERRIGRMVRSLVQGKLIKARAVRKRRLWVF